MSTLEQILTAQTTFISQLKTDLDNLMNREYGYTHDEIVTDSLEADYQVIITEDSNLANVSAVGLLALMKNGDTIATQGNILFVNGSEEENGYTFSGTNSQGGVELVKIWYFENEGSLSLQKLGFTVMKIIEKTVSATPSLSNDFYDYADDIEYDTAPAVVPLAVRKQKNYTGGTLSDNVSAQVEEYESYCTTIPNQYAAILRSNTNVKKVRFPYLTTIAGGGSDGFFKGCTSLTDFYFPMLETITGVSSNASAPFHSVPKVTLPESVQTVGSRVFYSTGEIILNCKDAASIDTNFCYNTPYQSFTMCSDWAASINIATAAANWSMQQYIDFMTDNLRDMTLTSETRTLVIPAAMLTSLQADTDGAAAITAANAKGWTIGA